MNKKNMNVILQKIREYPKICIFRHMRNDGDCVGASKGLQEILKLSYPEKEIYLIDQDRSELMAFLGPDRETAPDSVYEGSLGIVVDTATKSRISNQKYTLCKELVKIDHHIPVEHYADYEWVEEERSSACEMIAEFYCTFRHELKINRTAATYIYAGMVTDSGRFRFRSVSGETMRLAGELLDLGVDTDWLYAHLYLDDLEHLKFKSYVYKNMKITENGVVSIFVSKAVQEKFGLSHEAAGACVSFMESIKGCLCWIAFIETGDGEKTVRVRLRSRFAAVNTVAEQYRGGGHACACGATVYGRKEMKALLQTADETIRVYKQTHEGWL